MCDPFNYLSEENYIKISVPFNIILKYLHKTFKMTEITPNPKTICMHACMQSNQRWRRYKSAIEQLVFIVFKTIP